MKAGGHRQMIHHARPGVLCRQRGGEREPGVVGGGVPVLRTTHQPLAGERGLRGKHAVT